ncbi:hypothetical protein MIR68_010140 [Amoeboaphelidium protococcarum]|nr:hypothetical protein MIR68_010140 [Amoeboaphelidium protococcarum]
MGIEVQYGKWLKQQYPKAFKHLLRAKYAGLCMYIDSALIAGEDEQKILKQQRSISITNGGRKTPSVGKQDLKLKAVVICILIFPSSDNLRKDGPRSLDSWQTSSVRSLLRSLNRVLHGSNISELISDIWK